MAETSTINVTCDVCGRQIKPGETFYRSVRYTQTVRVADDASAATPVQTATEGGDYCESDYAKQVAAGAIVAAAPIEQPAAPAATTAPSG